MILWDTDTLTLYFAAHARIMARTQEAVEAPVTSIVSRIEILQGRMDAVLKAADKDQLLRAQERLATAERDLAKFTIIPFNALAAEEFNRLQQNKKLKKIGRADLLIVASSLPIGRRWSPATFDISARYRD